MRLRLFREQLVVIALRRRMRKRSGICLCRSSRGVANPPRRAAAAVPCESPSFFKCLRHQAIPPRELLSMISAFGVSWPLGLWRHHGLESTHLYENWKARRLVRPSHAVLCPFERGMPFSYFDSYRVMPEVFYVRRYTIADARAEVNRGTARKQYYFKVS